MKKLIIILTVLFCAANAFSQEAETTGSVPRQDYAKHRLHIYGGAGYTNNIYSRVNDISANYSYSALFEMKYAYFFKEKWGFSLGAGVSRFSAKGTLGMSNMLKEFADGDFNMLLPQGTNRVYDLYYKATDLVEKQQIWAVEVPFQFNFEHKVNRTSGIYAGLGATGYFPIHASSKFPKGNGTLTTWAFEDAFKCWYGQKWNANDQHFGDTPIGVAPKVVKMRPSVDIVGEFGGIFRLSEIADLYLGVYGSYGFLDILPKAENKADFISFDINNTSEPYVVNSLLASNYLSVYNETNKDVDGFKPVSEKWNRWQAGVKVGFHIKPLGKKERQEKRMRDARKDYYQDGSEYFKKAGDKEPQIIYIQPTPPVQYMEDPKTTPKEKEDMTALVDAFSEGKIYFDLNSSDPKISDKKFIYDAVETLKRNPSWRVYIEGYTCDLGPNDYNKKLAKKRAEAIRDLFVKEGVNPSQIIISGYTVLDSKNQQNFGGKSREEHRAVVFRIENKR